MKRFALPLLIALTALLLTSCVSMGEKYKPVALKNPAHALVIIYRPTDYCNLTDPFYFSANDNEFVLLSNNAYTTLEAVPGFYTVRVKNIVTRFTKYDQGSETFEFEAGKRYHIKYHRICKLFAPDINFLDIIEENIAKGELKEMGYVKPMQPELSNPKHY